MLSFRGNHVPSLWVVVSSLAPSLDQSLCLLYLNPPHPASLRYNFNLSSSWHCGAVWFSWKSVWDWLPRFVLCPHVCPWWLYTQQVHISFNPASRQTPAGPSGKPVCLPTALDSLVFLNHLPSLTESSDRHRVMQFWAVPGLFLLAHIPTRGAHWGCL